MKKIVAIFTGVSALLAVAAPPVQYYVADEALAAGIAAKITEGITDPDQRLVRENSINEAFAELFRISRVKTRDVAAMMEALKLRDALGDSLSVLNSTIEQAGEVEVAVDTTATDTLQLPLRNDIAHLQLRINQLKQEIDSTRKMLAADSLELASSRIISDSISASLAVRRAQLDTYLSDDDVIKSAQFTPRQSKEE